MPSAADLDEHRDPASSFAGLPLERLVDAGCPLCGSAERSLRFRASPFAVFLCGSCDLTYVSPRFPHDLLLQHVYAESYWRSPAARERGYSDYRGDAALYLRTFERRRALIDRYFARPGRVLDVGCAAGYFLSVMQRQGWSVAGVEPSDSIRSSARERLGRDVLLVASLDDPELERERFDLVAMWDVLEHLSDPLAALRRARELLEGEGLLLIETQNVRSLAARLLGKRWHHYKHAEHLMHFHRGTLTRALEASGFTPLKITARWAGKYVSPAFIAERAQRLHPFLTRALAPLSGVQLGIYVNPFDELIALSRRRESL